MKNVLRILTLLIFTVAQAGPMENAMKGGS